MEELKREKNRKKERKISMIGILIYICFTPLKITLKET
jgi:hypothetical protein